MIPRKRQKELRRKALHVIWQVLDAACREIDLQAIDHGDISPLTDNEVQFMQKIIDGRAQTAFNAYADYREATGN
jgi:predicted nucleotidyltransferase